MGNMVGISFLAKKKEKTKTNKKNKFRKKRCWLFLLFFLFSKIPDCRLCFQIAQCVLPDCRLCRGEKGPKGTGKGGWAKGEKGKRERERAPGLGFRSGVPGAPPQITGAPISSVISTSQRRPKTPPIWGGHPSRTCLAACSQVHTKFLSPGNRMKTRAVRPVFSPRFPLPINRFVFCCLF